MTTLAAGLALAGGYVAWRIGPDWREHILTISLDVILRRNP